MAVRCLLRLRCHPSDTRAWNPTTRPTRPGSNTPPPTLPSNTRFFPRQLGSGASVAQLRRFSRYRQWLRHMVWLHVRRGHRYRGLHSVHMRTASHHLEGGGCGSAVSYGHYLQQNSCTLPVWQRAAVPIGATTWGFVRRDPIASSSGAAGRRETPRSTCRLRPLGVENACVYVWQLSVCRRWA